MPTLKVLSDVISRRDFGRAAAALSLSLAGVARAQVFPDRPVTMIVPFPPGGTNDIVARALAEGLGRELKQSVIVDNRSGAGGNVGADMVARAKPDGYTLLVSTAGPLAINRHLYTKQSYDPAKDFAPVTLLASVPIMLVTGPKQPFTSVADLIAYAKANPGKLTYGSQGNGTTSHLTMELLKSRAGIDLLHVPYRGSAPATADLLGGVIQVMFDNSPSTLPFVQSHSMRALGVANPKRVAAMKDIPAIAETVPGFESSAWFGVVAPKGTPPEIVQALNVAANTVLKRPDVQKQFALSGAELAGGSPDALARHMASESAKWAAVVQSANVHLD